MIFTADIAVLVKANRITQTRRPVKRHSRWGFEIPCPYVPGRIYRARAAQRWTAAALRVERRMAERAQPTRARAVLAYLAGPLADVSQLQLEITVLSVRREQLGEITPQDARREGFKFTADFEKWWARHHGGWDPDTPVWVISFSVGDDRDYFDRLHLLARNPGHVSDNDEHQDYVSEPRLAMYAEPEAVSGSDLGKQSADAQQRYLRIRADQARNAAASSLTERLRAIQAGTTVSTDNADPRA